ncbi:MAG TPA: hypothetical protein VFW44_00335 [Bryobacteraceae bacterium]|nr:hypothetical protein [Bryobacteraceae bacterium]
MTFLLTGFTHDGGFRVFTFEGISADRLRAAFTVRADLALSRRYGIRLQDLPLICRALLEGIGEEEQQHSFTFTEDAMRLRANDIAAAHASAASSKKPPRKKITENTGMAWRSPSPI